MSAAAKKAKVASPQAWVDANQRYLTTALAVVKRALEVRSGATPTSTEAAVRKKLDSARKAVPGVCALDAISTLFGLSEFERAILLLCAGVELDGTLGALCAAAHQDPRRPYPTFALALAALPEPHWSAISPSGPLRRWRLIELTAGDNLTTACLRIDERILHYLAGVSYIDLRLNGLIEPVGTVRFSTREELVSGLARVWALGQETGQLPVIQLTGPDASGKLSAAQGICEAVGLRLFRISSSVIPQAPSELETLVQSWEREAALSGAALAIDVDEETNEPGRPPTSTRMAERARGAVFLCVRERVALARRPSVVAAVNALSTVEQAGLWRSLLGKDGRVADSTVLAASSHFHLTAPEIRAAADVVLADAAQDGDAVLWEACRAQARPRMENLAQRIVSNITWDDLILPEPQIGALREIAAEVRQRRKVYEEWGFAAKNVNGLGISALFSGGAGTGKTMAAGVIASALRLDLYRIDLSAVVSKYIGETEKNLRRVFDAAEEGGAVLLFDEADALFGKRSEVKDSHDRYANIEISYLLQRMEAYSGLAILTTNMKGAVDPAFLRRIRFLLDFPFPSEGERARIWQRVFPAQTPTRNLDYAKLASLHVSGGGIRNIAMRAAFLAAEAGEPVTMPLLLRAARSEYTKLEKTLSAAEAAGWE